MNRPVLSSARCSRPLCLSALCLRHSPRSRPPPNSPAVTHPGEFGLAIHVRACKTCASTMSENTASIATSSSPGKLPRGVPFIIGNEAAERFSYYGMMSILTIYLTKQMNMGRKGARKSSTSSPPPFIFCRSSARGWRTNGSGATGPFSSSRFSTARAMARWRFSRATFPAFISAWF